MIPVFFGTIKNSKVILREPDLFNLHISRFDGKDVEVIVRPARSKRSLDANKFYWGIVVELAARHFGYTKAEMHEIFKSMFNSEVIHFQKKEVKIVKSTASLSVKRFSEYVDRCIRFCAEEGIIIPASGEVEIL